MHVSLSLLFAKLFSASGAGVCVCTPVPLLWLRVGGDVYGSAWHHAGLPLYWLQQPS